MKTRFANHRLTLLTLAFLLAGALLAIATNPAWIVSAAPPNATLTVTNTNDGSAVAPAKDNGFIYGPMQSGMTYNVNSNADADDGSCDGLNCTLREAINAANANPGPDQISFSIAGTINLSSALPAISDSVQVSGPGASQLTVQRSSSAATDFAVFQLIAGQTLSISGLTISGGTGTFDGFDRKGGGILNFGTLNITDAALSDNNSEDGGGIFIGGGAVTITRSTLARNSVRNGGAAGGILNAGGTLNVTSSTFVNNDGDVEGGAIMNSGTATVRNSTFSGNHSFNYAGAIVNDGTLTISNSSMTGNFSGAVGAIGSGGTLEIYNSTISGNSADTVGGISVGGTVNIRNSIIAANTATVGDPDIAGAFNDLGHNLIGGDPRLGPLQDNGGPTLTMAPLCDSPAIDAGDNTSAPDTDQRGLPRIVSGYQSDPPTIDIGAVELQTVCDRPPVAAAKNITVPADQNCAATITAQQVDAGSFDPDSGDTMTLSLNKYGPFSLGDHQVTLTVTDNQNLSSSATATVTVVDSTPPTITLQGANPLTVQSCSAFTDPGATASDNCAGNLTSSIVVTGSVNTSAPGTYVLHYNVADPGNNSAQEITRTVNVVDTAPPIIALNGASSTQVETCSSFVDPGATATDCSGNLTNAIVVTGSVNISVAGTYTLHYNVRDASNNAAAEVTRIVNVVDTTRPVITLTGQSPMTVEACSMFHDPGATASDNCSGNLTNAIVVTGNVNTSVPGNYTLHYNVHDVSNNAATEVTRIVNVVDTTRPVITLNGANPITVELGSAFSNPGATASDGCRGSVAVISSGSINVNAVGTYTLTYNAKDASSNQALAVTRTVKVVDTTAPIVAAPAASSGYSDINCQAAVPNVLPQVIASDLGGPVTLSQSPAAGTLVGIGPRMITITGKDPSNNSKSVTTTFTVVAGPSFTVSVSPSSVKRGNVVNLTTAFNNCATTRQTLTLKVSLITPHSNDLMLTLPVVLQAGQHGSLSIPLPIAKATPTGLYSLTLDVYVGTTKVGTSTAQLTVTP